MLCRLNGLLRVVLGIGLVLLVCGLMAAQDIKTNYVPGTNFTKYKTYKWVNIDASEQPDPIVGQKIVQAVDGQLASKV